MKKYACNILYKFTEIDSKRLFNLAIKNIGFSPSYMDIHFEGMKKSIEDATFDINQLHGHLKATPGVITIKNQLYNEDNRETNDWFRFRLIFKGAWGLNFCSLEWSNSQLDFLTTENWLVNNFLIQENLLYCYCYDQYDCMDQSNSKISSFKRTYPNESFKTVINYMGDEVIDLSTHWGRYVSTQGITFIAAPLMWFGKEYFKIIPEQKLIKFENTSLIRSDSFDLIHIKLFDLYSNPSERQNRDKQRRYWEYFNLQSISNKLEEAK
jgi:hypothetical protein